MFYDSVLQTEQEVSLGKALPASMIVIQELMAG
jgi:hypothetical protein